MHTAIQLNASQFDVEIDGQRVDIGALLPDWHALDRFGIVVTEALGSLGASLLIQLTITAFYDFRREHRRMRAVYPEIYLFHVGGKWGDHSTLDFWPPRKEVFLPADPPQVLAALNNFAITRLAVPDAPGAKAKSIDWLDDGKERTTARERITSVFCYGAGGSVGDADVRISATGPVTEENISAILDPHSILAASESRQIGDTPTDVVFRLYLGSVRDRQSEVAADIRVAKAETRKRLREAGPYSESYRRIEFARALSLFTT
jgi:hypothetical protein